MKSFKYHLKESIVDVPRKHYSKYIFDNHDTEDPILKPEVKRQIMYAIKKYTAIAPYKKYFLLGSILTKKYRDDTDLDINVLFDVPEDRKEEIHQELRKLSSENNGKPIHGSNHPLNIFVLVDEKEFVKSATRAEAVFDIKNNTFVKKATFKKLDTKKYEDELNRYFKKIDVMKGELRRSIIDYKEVFNLSDNEIENHSKLIKKIIRNIQDDINELIEFYEDKTDDRKELFNKNYDDLSKKEKEKYDKYKSFNYLPKNVVYKSLERYGYFDFIKKLKEVIGEDLILSKDEADKLLDVISIC